MSIPAEDTGGGHRHQIDDRGTPTAGPVNAMQNPLLSLAI